MCYNSSCVLDGFAHKPGTLACHAPISFSLMLARELFPEPECSRTMQAPIICGQMCCLILKSTAVWSGGSLSSLGMASSPCLNHRLSALQIDRDSHSRGPASAAAGDSGKQCHPV